MKISIKTKLYLGFGFLFLLIVLLWTSSFFYLYRLTNYSDAMLKDNYKSMVSAKLMAQNLDEIKILQTKYFYAKNKFLDMKLYSEKLNEFKKNLIDEELNITEKGEKELAKQLRMKFENYISLFNKAKSENILNKDIYLNELIPAYNEVNNLIMDISDLNMNAIIKKNNELKATSHRAFLYISILGTLCFLISFSFCLNFPRNIANPVKDLTRGIREIARKNYNQQLYIDSKDEFGEMAEAFNTMAKKLSEYEHSNVSQLLFEKKRIETIISKMRDAIIGLNERKEIIFSNPLACELLNVKADDIIGKSASETAAKNDLLKNIFHDLFDNSYKKTGKELKTLKIFADGKESFFTKDIFEVNTTKTGEEKHILVGYVVILKNITKFQELDEAKTKFISTVSHEFKTPISSIKMSLKLLEDQRIGTVNDEQRHLIKSIKDESDRLLNITGELLNISQVETGNLQLNILNVEPNQIIDYAFDAVKIQAEQKMISINVTKEGNLPQIKADPEKTAWVLINLLSNAIRHSSEKSKIIVDIRRNENKVEFSVKDFSEGIEDKYLDKIFNRYFQIPGSNKSGSGLGLAICKEFIEAQGGKIWVESEIGKGSKFSFNLNG
ncbi:MAG: ATP-binding protein [Bacteroidales bacterium]|nr:ATP-binding protein [Bacteroidales bacterium]